LKSNPLLFYNYLLLNQLVRSSKATSVPPKKNAVAKNDPGAPIFVAFERSCQNTVDAIQGRPEVLSVGRRTLGLYRILKSGTYIRPKGQLGKA
jgi:hypothetical protein